MIKTIRTFSTNKTNINTSNINISKINDYKVLSILPSIEYTDNFCIELHKILLSLDPTFTYTLEFCLFMYTTKKNKGFIPLYSGMPELYDQKIEYFIKRKQYWEQIKSEYKFKGYVNILSNTININELDIEIDYYAWVLFSCITNNIREANSDPQKEIIEDMKPLVLIIKKVK